jgi:hypothetical protein
MCLAEYVHIRLRGKKMGNRAKWFCFTLVLLGVLDWLITTVGVLFCGAQEVNPILTGLTQSNMMLFSIVKLSATVVIGLLFYQGGTWAGNENGCLASRFLFSGYLMALVPLTAVVTNNIVAIIGLL